MGAGTGVRRAKEGLCGVGRRPIELSSGDSEEMELSSAWMSFDAVRLLACEEKGMRE